MSDISPFGSNTNEPNYDARQEAGTPQRLFDLLNAEFEFEIDVAATIQNRKRNRYISVQDDALADDIEWVVQTSSREYGVVVKCHRCWLNPPFNNLAPWLEKAHSEAQKSASAVIVVLVPGRPSSKGWWHLAMKASEIRILTNHRVQFDPPDGVTYKSGNSGETFLLIYRRNIYDTPPVFVPFPWKRLADQILGPEKKFSKE